MNTLDQQVADFRLHRPHAQLHHRALRNDVGGDTGLEGADADHCRFPRRHVARHNALQGHHQRRTGDDRVDGALGVGAVAAVAGNRDFDGVRRGHEVTGVEAQLAYRQAWHVVQAKDAFAGELLEQAVFNH